MISFSPVPVPAPLLLVLPPPPIPAANWPPIAVMRPLSMAMFPPFRLLVAPPPIPAPRMPPVASSEAYRLAARMMTEAPVGTSRPARYVPLLNTASLFRVRVTLAPGSTAKAQAPLVALTSIFRSSARVMSTVPLLTVTVLVVTSTYSFSMMYAPVWAVSSAAVPWV